jgi:hypothetical protein
MQLGLMTSGQDEESALAQSVNDTLDVRKEVRHTLYLIENGAALELLQESSGIDLGLPTKIGVF